jgi:hypothetical protein
MSRGIRQDCPISTKLYLFVAEIQALKIKHNSNIEGIKINENEIKSIHADDLTVAVLNKNSLMNTINVIHEFCEQQGSKININKTECILLGILKDNFKEMQGIKVTGKALKCLGIF